MNNNETRIYTKKEFLKILDNFAYTILKDKKYTKLISKEFSTNIMLAVTEVNGCQVCNYHHTKTAIKNGIDDEELKGLLTGNLQLCKNEERQALLFGQHYAFEKENYDKETFSKVIDKYGEPKAKGILGTIRIISFGNAYGINAGNFNSRFTKKGSVKGSSIFNELFITISPLIFFPILIIKNLFVKRPKHQPN